MSEKNKDQFTKEERTTIGQNILAALTSRDLSMAELAKFCEIHRSYMSRMLRAQNDNIGNYLPPITKFLDVTVKELLNPEPSTHQRKKTLPFGALDARRRQIVPSGCVLQGVDEGLDAPMSVGKWLLLGPVSMKPQSGALVWCECNDGTIYVRQYLPDARDPSRFILTNNMPGDGPVALDKSQVVELRTVAIANIKITE